MFAIVVLVLLTRPLCAIWFFLSKSQEPAYYITSHPLALSRFTAPQVSHCGTPAPFGNLCTKNRLRTIHPGLYDKTLSHGRDFPTVNNPTSSLPRCGAKRHRSFCGFVFEHRCRRIEFDKRPGGPADLDRKTLTCVRKRRPPLRVF